MASFLFIVLIFTLCELQRDMAERGHSLESIKASIEARKPDFDAYIGIVLCCYILIVMTQIHT